MSFSLSLLFSPYIVYGSSALHDVSPHCLLSVFPVSSYDLVSVLAAELFVLTDWFLKQKMRVRTTRKLTMKLHIDSRS